MSTINTNGLDVNYPIPGQNNSTQGFRNNFTNIKQNLDTAASEISDLQNKVVLKSALANSTINNNMGNTLIANAAVLQFRNVTYNLGNALVDNILVDCKLGDVQYGNLAGNINLSFASWVPTGTLGGIQLQLGRPNADADFSITFSSNVTIDNNHGIDFTENFSTSGNLAVLTFPYNVTQLNLMLTSVDCGNSIFVTPLNRAFQTAQIQQRTPTPTGYLGDVAGTVAVDANYLYVCTDTYDSTKISANAISTTASTDVVTFTTTLPGTVVANMPVVFDSMFVNGNNVTSFGNINAGDVYYVKTVSGANITLSDTRTAGTAGTTLQLTDVTANTGNTYMDASFYSGSNIWKRVSLTAW